MKFTLELDQHESPFLDVLVLEEDKQLHNNTFYKTIDTQKDLDYRSFHPKYTRHKTEYPVLSNKTDMSKANV